MRGSEMLRLSQCLVIAQALKGGWKSVKHIPHTRNIHDDANDNDDAVVVVDDENSNFRSLMNI